MTGRAPASRRPLWVVVLDLLTSAALAFALLVWLVGPLPEINLFGAPFTSSHPARALLVVGILLAVRTVLFQLPAWIRERARAFRNIQRDDELTPLGRSWPANALEFVSVTGGFAALVALATWPQARDLWAVPDLGDPLFSAWRLGWVAHQLPADITHLFDANIFHPERLTLTYSDAMLVPALIAAPFLWLGAPLLPTTAALFLGAWVTSGVATYYLVRALTCRREAAVVAGAIFAIYPYRSEHYSHFELQFAMWMPFTCWALERTMATARLRDGVLLGLGLALQMLSSLYYGLFLALYLVPLGLTRWWSRGWPSGRVRPLLAGAAVTAVLVAPIAVAYIANKPMFGERPKDAIEFYSARVTDYLDPHFRSAVYGRWAEGGSPERQLFPGLVVIALGLLALWPRWTTRRLGYALAGLVAFDGSMGLNGLIYPWLYEWVPPFSGLRAPARFSILVGLSLAVLAGFVVARASERWPRRRLLLAAALVALVFVDMRPRLELTPAWKRPPEIYSAMAAVPGAVLAEFPVGLDAKGIPFEHYYTYFSTFHWHPMLNGASGFIPPSWEEFEARTRSFPSRESLVYLRARGVQFIAVHGALYPTPDAFEAARAALLDEPDLVRVAAARFAGGSSELYRFRPPGSP